MPNKTKNNQKKKTMQKQAKYTEKYLQKKIPFKEARVEFKSQLIGTGTNPQYGYTLSELTNIATLGATGTFNPLKDKLFDRIYLHGIQLNMSFNNTQATTRAIRIMVVRYKNPSSSWAFSYPPAASLPYLYESVSYVGENPSGLMQDSTLQINRDRFQIYYDKCFPVPPTNQGAKTIRRWVKIGRNVDYRQNATLNNLATNGRIFLIVGSIELKNAFTSTDPMFVFGSNRIFFKDNTAV